MNNSLVSSNLGDYWFYHPIGVGIVYSYNFKRNQLITTCINTGKVIDTRDYIGEEVFQTQKEFEEATSKIYLSMILDGLTIELNYTDNSNFVGCVGVDFSILRN